MELFCTILILGAFLVAVWLAWRRCERERAVWWEWHHPPDSEIREDGETSSGAAAPPSPKGEGKEGDDG